MFYKKENKFEAPSMDYASLYPTTMRDYTNKEFIRKLKREERKRKLRQIAFFNLVAEYKKNNEEI